MTSAPFALDAGSAPDPAHPVLALAACPELREEPAAGALPDDVAARVDELWRAERRTRPGIVDGRLFSRLDARPVDGALRGRFVPYRHWLAQLREPALARALAVRPLAVCGVTATPDGLLLGRRAPTTTQFPGAWEWVPAGSLDEAARRPDGTLDPIRALRAELREELGLGDDVAVRPLAWQEDVATGVAELVFAVATPRTLDEVRAAWRARGDAEYTALRAVPLSALDALVGDVAAALVPASRALGRVLRRG